MWKYSWDMPCEDLIGKEVIWGSEDGSPEEWRISDIEGFYGGIWLVWCRHHIYKDGSYRMYRLPAGYKWTIPSTCKVSISKFMDSHKCRLCPYFRR